MFSGTWTVTAFGKEEALQFSVFRSSCTPSRFVRTRTTTRLLHKVHSLNCDEVYLTNIQLYHNGTGLSAPQSQHSHLVIQQLLGHLDANSRSPASVRAGIMEVLSEAAVIEATGSVGQSVDVCV